jgi:hypothetical protein
LAAIASGGAIGFLFSVPRETAPMVVRLPDARALKIGTEYQLPVAKTNLEEIAQWLSKLIVGGTIFESGNVLKLLQGAGQEFAKTVGKDNELLAVLRHAREYLKRSGSEAGGRIWLNIARAYGQCYAWLSEGDNPTPCGWEVALDAEPPFEFNEENNRPKSLKWIEQKALIAIKNAIAAPGVL